MVIMAMATMTNTASANQYNQGATYAQVVDVQPVYENYQVPQNRQVCDNNSRNRSNNTVRSGNGGGAILGGLIGGIIGNRFGKGHGRRAATVAGVFAGAAIGSGANSQSYNNNRYSQNRYSNNRNSRRACYSQRDYRQEQRIAGYDVSYDYNGQIYRTRMQNHPGDRVRVQVNVQVAEY